MKLNGLLFCCFCLIQQFSFGQSDHHLLFQLAPPLIQSSATFFEQETQIELKLGLENVQLFYTLDGKEPNPESQRYQQTIVLNKSAELRVKAFHECCSASETVSARFFKVRSNSMYQNCRLQEQAHENYPANGKHSLHDGIKGSNSYQDKAWLGFGKEDLTIFYTSTTKQESFHKIVVSTLSDPNSWIFPPCGLELWTSSDGKQYNCIAKDSFEILTEMESPQLRYYSLEVPKTTDSYYKLVVKNTRTLPNWHLRAGKGSWLFVDEIIWQ